MPGAVSMRAGWILSQKTAVAANSADEEARLRKKLDEENERFAETQDASVWRDVCLSQEALARAQSAKQGSASAAARYKTHMNSEEFRKDLAHADECWDKVQALDFAGQFQSNLQPRIYAAAKALADLIPEIMQLVNDNASVERDLIIALERVNMHEITAKSVLDQDTGLARFREATADGFRATKLEDHILRASLGWRP